MMKSLFVFITCLSLCACDALDTKKSDKGNNDKKVAPSEESDIQLALNLSFTELCEKTRNGNLAEFSDSEGIAHTVNSILEDRGLKSCAETEEEINSRYYFYFNSDTIRIKNLVPFLTLHEIEYLSFENQNLIENLEPLTHLPNLKELGIDASNLSDFQALKDMESLVDLSLWGLPEFVQDLNFLSDLTGLVSLEILDIDHIIDYSAIGELENLKFFGLFQLNGVKDLEFIKNLLALESLSVQYTDLNDISAISNLTSLKNLYLIESPIMDLTSLSGLSLETLHLNLDNNLDLNPVGNIKTLTTFTFRPPTGFEYQSETCPTNSLTANTPVAEACTSLQARKAGIEPRIVGDYLSTFYPVDTPLQPEYEKLQGLWCYDSEDCENSAVFIQGNKAIYINDIRSQHTPITDLVTIKTEDIELTDVKFNEPMQMNGVIEFKADGSSVLKVEFTYTEERNRNITDLTLGRGVLFKASSEAQQSYLGQSYYFGIWNEDGFFEID